MRDKKNLYFLVFAEGFVVLAIQILSSILLNPYWGSTFMFWSIQLFFVMSALSLAYYLPSRIKIKDKKNLENKLYYLLLILVFYLCGLFIFSEAILNFLIISIPSPVAGIIVSLFFFIFMPVTFLGQIPVIVIMHKKLDHGQHESRISGIVFSISSIAGILAVLISACIMIPLLGINYTLLLLILIFIGFQWYFTKTIDKRINIWILTCLCIISAIILIGREKKIHTSFNKNELIKISEVQNGILGQLKVVVNKSTNTKYLYVNNSLQSKTHLTGRSLYPYLYSLVTYASFKPANSDVLIAGMGAGSLVYEFSMLNFNVDVVDIDERLQGISERNFLLPSKEFHFIKSDIRRFIKKSSKKYDVIVLDLSKGEAVPTNVYTYESFLECQKLLKENGIILIHFLSSLSEDGQLALASIKRTLKQTGFECEIMNRKNQKHLLDGVSDLTIPDGYILLSAKKIDLSNAEFIIDPSLIKELIPQKENLFLEFDESRGLLLTDDKPILDILEMQNTIYMRKQNIKALIQINKYAK